MELEGETRTPRTPRTPRRGEVKTPMKEGEGVEDEKDDSCQKVNGGKEKKKSTRAH